MSMDGMRKLRLATAAALVLSGSPADASAQNTKGAPSPALSASDTYTEGSERVEFAKIELSDLLAEQLDEMKSAAIERFRGNIFETAERIPDLAERSRFMKLQARLLSDLNTSPHGMYLPTEQHMKRLSLWATPHLRELHAALKDNEHGLFIDAGERGQTLHLVRREGGTLRFRFSARITTGEDGLSPTPDKDSNATKSGLLRIQQVVKDHVVPGQDVSWERRTVATQNMFTVMSKQGDKLVPKPIYIADPEQANVGLIAFRLYKSQALHEGPIRKGPASHGCTRANGVVIATLDRLIGKGTPVMISAPTEDQMRAIIAAEVPAPKEARRERPADARPKLVRPKAPERSRPDPLFQIFGKSDGG